MVVDKEFERFNLIRLTRSVGITNSKLHNLLRLYNSFTNIINNIQSIDKNIVLASESDVGKELSELKNINAGIITCLDNNYPKLLKQSDSFPFTLTYRGNINLLNNTKTLAMIGSRNCSINSYNFSKKIAKEVSSYGYIIVSGLARGIDSSAHVGSVINGTIAVLGSGINIIYPRENEYLYYDIIKNNGLILSEFPLHTAPKPDNFIMRNRIIAGLAKGVLVVEAGIASGTMHTVRQALKLNREIMVFPGNPYDDRCAGSNKLLQDGANMVINTKDIITCLESFVLNDYLENNKTYYNIINSQQTTEEKKQIKTTCGKDMNNNNEENIENIILSKLDYSFINISELIDNLDYNLNSINTTLTKLQLEGKIIINNGKIGLKLK